MERDLGWRGGRVTDRSYVGVAMIYNTSVVILNIHTHACAHGFSMISSSQCELYVSTIIIPVVKRGHASRTGFFAARAANKCDRLLRSFPTLLMDRTFLYHDVVVNIKDPNKIK